MRSNAALGDITSRLRSAEAISSILRSFNFDGANMAFGGGQVQFNSQTVGGNVYAPIVSPQGAGLAGTLLHQTNDGVE